MPAFDMPDVLKPVRESIKCVRVPNVAVGKVQIEGKVVPVFSAFLSHVCMLDKEKWKLIQVPTEHFKASGIKIVELDDEKDLVDVMKDLSVESPKTMPVFVDPITMDVFEGCIWHFYSGDRDDIACMRAHVNEHDARTAWYDVGTRYGVAMENFKKSVTPGKEPPTEPEAKPEALKKTEISTSSPTSKTQECPKHSKVSPLSSATEAEA